MTENVQISGKVKTGVRADGGEDLDPFDIALKQLNKAASVMNLDPEALAILSQPQKVLQVSIPVKMDNGKTKVFTGFRVRYNTARGGPAKGGIRFHLRRRSQPLRHSLPG